MKGTKNSNNKKYLKYNNLQAVHETVKRRNFLLETLALTDRENLLDQLGVFVGDTVHQLPMVKDGLGESLTTGGLTKIGSETEGLGDGQVSLDDVHGGTGALFLTDGVS